MVLCITGEGPLGTAVRAAFAERGEPVRTAAPCDDDLFAKASGCRAIVYAPAPDLLDGRLHPAPSTERMRSVLGATQAAGVELLVVCVPTTGYEDEETALRKYGVPYVIVRTPPLIEEIAAQPAVGESGAVWLARGRRAAVASAAPVGEALVRASTDDSAQGATLDAPCEVLDAAEVLRRAATLRGRASVRTVSPGVDAFFRGVGRIFRVREPAIVALQRQLAAV